MRILIVATNFKKHPLLLRLEIFISLYVETSSYGRKQQIVNHPFFNLTTLNSRILQINNITQSMHDQGLEKTYLVSFDTI